MNRSGEPEDIKQKMKKINTDVMSMSEVRWRGKRDDIKVICSGGNDSKKGVVLTINNEPRTLSKKQHAYLIG